MKRILLLLILISISLKTKAQVVFCPTGAEWNYSFVDAFTGTVRNEKITYTGDSILNNESVKRLKHYRFFNENNYQNPTALTFIKQNGDTVFMRNFRTNNQWQILYNFAAPATQGWYNTIKDATPNLVQHYTAVDSVDSITANGFTLKRLFVTMYNNRGGVWRPGKKEIIIERYGNIKFLFDYTNVETESDQDMIADFLCYKDNSFGLKQFTTLPCDYQTRVGIDEITFGEQQLSIYPNPFQDKLHLDLETNTYQKIKISIFNTLGREIFLKDKVNPKEELDLTFLNEGIYFIKIESGSKIKTVKIMKD